MVLSGSHRTAEGTSVAPFTASQPSQLHTFFSLLAGWPSLSFPGLRLFLISLTLVLLFSAAGRELLPILGIISLDKVLIFWSSVRPTFDTTFKCVNFRQLRFILLFCDFCNVIGEPAGATRSATV